MKRTLTVSLLLGWASVTFAQSAGTLPATPPTLAQAAQVNERLIRTMFGPGADVQFTYGAVPDTLPLKLDPRLTVVASIRTAQNGGAYVGHRVMVSSDLNAEAALAALRVSLEGSGWKQRPTYGTPIGFATQQTNRYSSYYREGTPNFSLDANVTERNGHTDLDLNLNVVSAQTIASFKKTTTFRPQSSLPLLRAMPGATVKGNGYSPKYVEPNISPFRKRTENASFPIQRTFIAPRSARLI